MEIITIHEHKRKCGHRKPGGLYLVSDGLAEVCYKLPIPLTVCPSCGQGIKFSRGYTWIDDKLIRKAPCKKEKCRGCKPFDGSVERFGLLWIGKCFYKDPADFVKESLSLGVSRRINTIPREFKLGETWILTAHIKAYLNEKTKKMEPGIFHAFRPQRIEYVVKDTDSKKYLQSLADRGITLVKINRITEKQTELKITEDE